MGTAQHPVEKELYDVGNFGDARLKKRCSSVPAHGVPANGLSAATGGKPGARSQIWPLAVDAADGTCLGLAHLHHWNRTGKAAPNYRKLPIEDKESYRWLEVAWAGKKCLSAAGMVTIAADRESDIYEEWARLPDAYPEPVEGLCYRFNPIMVRQAHHERIKSAFP